MMKIKTFAAMLLLCFVSQTIVAQENEERQRLPKEEMIKKEWKGMAERLKLSDEQMNATEATYVAYRNELFEAMGGMRQEKREASDGEKKERRAGRKSMSDEEVKAMATKRFESERKRIDVREKYFAEFCKTLTPRQALTVVSDNNSQPNLKQRRQDNDDMRGERFGGPGMPPGGMGPGGW